MKMFMSCPVSDKSAADPQQFKDGSNYFFYRPAREMKPLEFLVSESEPDDILAEIEADDRNGIMEQAISVAETHANGAPHSVRFA
ncbi:hypothetical protein FLW98_26975 [Raoultella planticola]|uniref:hypothetical protein n=1 Tax=Raoultella planticola TaxID=575 RepID=UPI0011546FE4|nr:hypothetical protein [Raoultella planticola]TQN52780.1 hypothetical protein FLW98_26975 [Raoultella planticola]